MAEHIWRIYRYYNPIEDKSYIGQTTKNVNTRAGNGHNYHGTKFRDAIDKYGWDVFEQSILRLCISQEEADYWERYFIDKYDSIESGYNTSSGGNGGNFLDECHTEEQRKKWSKSRSGDNNPMYGIHRFGEDNPNYGKKHPGMNAGENNPAYGRNWYNNGTINIYINTNTTEIPEGFKKGRLYERRAK